MRDLYLDDSSREALYLITSIIFAFAQRMSSRLGLRNVYANVVDLIINCASSFACWSERQASLLLGISKARHWPL
jgi:hypothetical protein